MPLRVVSTTATTWGDRRVNRALRTLGRRPKDIAVWSAHPEDGPGLIVDAYAIPGCSAQEPAAAFESAFFRPAKGPWEVVEIGGRQVWSMGGTNGVHAWWASAGLVVRLVGDDGDVMAGIRRMP